MKLRILVASLAAFGLAFAASAAQAHVLTVVNMSNDGPENNGDNEVDIAINPANPLCNAWSNKKPTAIFVTTSRDGGRTWASPQRVASAETKAGNLDHPMMTIDHYKNRALLAYTGWSGLQANSFALVSDSTATVWSGPYRIAADYKSNAPDVFDVSLAGAPNGTIYATSGIWQHVNEWNEQSVVASQMRPGETAFTRSVKVRDLVPAPINLPGERWRTSMQASIGVDASGTVYHLTGD